MRGALVSTEEPPPEAWLVHQDEAVLRATAMAVSHDALMVLADRAEAEGAWVRAARYAWVAAKLGAAGTLTMAVWNDALYRAADLLALVPAAQRAEEAVRAFEVEVLTGCWIHDIGSTRQIKVNARRQELEDGGTFDAKIGDALGHFVS